jgi:hypothetical protein
MHQSLFCKPYPSPCNFGKGCHESPQLLTYLLTQMWHLYVWVSFGYEIDESLFSNLTHDTHTSLGEDVRVYNFNYLHECGNCMDLICFEDSLILVLKPTQDHTILREDVKVFLQLAQMWHFMGLMCLED